MFRLKGYISVNEESFLVNYVAGKWNFEKGTGKYKLVFIGEKIIPIQKNIEKDLQKCFRKT